MATGSKKTDDWFAIAANANRAGGAQRDASAMSLAWGRPSGPETAESRMPILRETLRSIVRIQGVPANCRIEWALGGHGVAGAAGFDDAPASFAQPYILLDQGVPNRCEQDEARDVYCGIALHEAGHVLYTRDGYRRSFEGMSPFRSCFDNFWEDERIELLVRRDSPGYAPYLQTTKRALLELGCPGRTLVNWHLLPDLDKVVLLLIAFIRLPHLISDDMMKWLLINGECFFETLRQTFAACPVSESIVGRYAVECERLWNRARALYPTTLERGVSGGFGSLGGSEECDRDVTDRIMRQLEADAEDRATVCFAGSDSMTAVHKRPTLADRILDEAVQCAARGWDRVAEGLLELAVAAERVGVPGLLREGRRFSAIELGLLRNRGLTVGQPRAPERTSVLAAPQNAAASTGGDWKWGSDRRTVIEIARAGHEDRRDYEAARRQVFGHIAALRAVFRIHLGERICRERERLHGRLDRRRLGFGATTERVFQASRVTTGPNMAFCVLLDESGSMERGEPARAQSALQATILMVEALKDMAGVDVEVYSHTSCGHSEQDCLIRYLYGRKNRSPTAIATYKPKRNNYDHQAILTAARLFQENTDFRRRLMLVVSDGYPSGVNYEGDAAIRATRESVDLVRRQGIQVINIAIADFHSEAIFGSANVVKFSDLSRLAGGLRALLVRMLRTAIVNA